MYILHIIWFGFGNSVNNYKIVVGLLGPSMWSFGPLWFEPQQVCCRFQKDVWGAPSTFFDLGYLARFCSKLSPYFLIQELFDTKKAFFSSSLGAKDLSQNPNPKVKRGRASTDECLPTLTTSSGTLQPICINIGFEGLLFSRTQRDFPHGFLFIVYETKTSLPMKQSPRNLWGGQESLADGWCRRRC